MSLLKRLRLALLSGILLGLSWPAYGFTPLLFFAFLPLLQLEHHFACRPDKYKLNAIFTFSYITFFTWNIISTWWVYKASLGGAAMAIFANAFLMSATFTIAHTIKRIIFKNDLSPDKNISFTMFVPFILCWIGFEYFHHDWDLTYPWLTLGNGLAANYKWVQWYEYTGTFGGSLWLLSINIVFFIHLYNKQYELKLKSKTLWTLISLITFPIIISEVIYSEVKINDGAKQYKIEVVQPNSDPYNEKFTAPFDKELDQMLQLALTKLDTSVDFLVFPETALTENIWENDMEKAASIDILQNFLKKYPKLVIVTGASTARVYQPGQPNSPTAQKFKDSDAYYDNYNTAFELDNTGKVQVYHKSKLVPGVEKIPFPALLKPFESLAINLGGTIGSLGTQDERTIFVSPGNVKVAPIICYESIYPEFISTYIKNGAQLLFIITNDGWWGDTPGYKQHLVYGRLRAIENRRCIARSANTGISCFINERGDIDQATQWWKPAVITASLPVHDELTFFAKHGDYIGRLAFYSSFILLIYAALIRFRYCF